MITSSRLVGLPVCLTTGEQVASIKLVIFDTVQHRVLGFLVGWGGWTGSAKVLPWSGSISIRHQGIHIPASSLIVPASKVISIKENLENPSLSLGSLVVSTARRVIGMLCDVHFDRRTAEIHGYEIIFARWNMAAGHCALVPPDQIRLDAGEVVLVHYPLVADQIRAQIENAG